METIITQLYHQVAANEVPSALAKLNSVLSLGQSEYLNEVILIQARYKKWSSDVRKGLLSSEEEGLEHRKIIAAILGLLQEIEESPGELALFHRVEDGFDKALLEKTDFPLEQAQKDALFERMAYLKERGRSFNALWVSDHPHHDQLTIDLIHEIGVELRLTSSSAEAKAAILAHQPKVLISDIWRGGSPTEGLDFLQQLRSEGIATPVIFYVRNQDKTRGVPAGAFGICALPHDLLHLVMDVVQRG